MYIAFIIWAACQNTRFLLVPVFFPCLRSTTSGLSIWWRVGIIFMIHVYLILQNLLWCVHLKSGTFFSQRMFWKSSCHCTRIICQLQWHKSYK